MNFSAWIIIGGIVAGFLVLKRLTLVRPETAREWLRKGAKVIDVRGEEEFRERHLPGAINIRLGQLRDKIASHAPNKDQALLLHCLSGGRSGMGKAMLRKMGYRNAFNLGSYRRAEKILSE